MSFIKQIAHTIHLMGFAFLLGNLIMDNVFGRRELKKEMLPLLGKLYTISWVSLIITGVLQVVLITKQFNYIYNSKFGTWIKMILVKTLITIITAFCIEGIVNAVVPAEKRRNILKVVRIALFCILFFISGFSREFREMRCTPKAKKSEETPQKKSQ